LYAHPHALAGKKQFATLCRDPGIDPALILRTPRQRGGIPFPPRTDHHKEAIMKARTLIPALLITFAASGCATWDNLSSREKSAATGAAVGGVAGAVVSNGGILGTVGGAAIGGVIGDQVGKKK
jgi:osmotically inducible lipoprotein OsmB